MLAYIKAQLRGMHVPHATHGHQNNNRHACKVKFTRIKCTLWMESACFLRSSLLSLAADDN